MSNKMKLRVGKQRVLAVSDIQEPFSHRDALKFVDAVRTKYKTDTTIFMGDEVDFHAVSPHYTPDPDGLGPGDELKQAVKNLKKWYELFDGEEAVKCVYSNHLHRIFKKCFAAGVPTAFIRSINEFLEAPPSWEWADHFIIDGVRYEHGDTVGGMYASRNLALARRCSVVIGHHHSFGGTYYISTDDGDCIFALTTGCLIDHERYAFNYAKGNRYGPTLGTGVIIHGVPNFVPMITNARGRWIGRIPS